MQIVPELQRLPGTQLSCFVRSKSWIGRPFGEAVANKLDEDGFKSKWDFDDSKLDTNIPMLDSARATTGKNRE